MKSMEQMHRIFSTWRNKFLNEENKSHYDEVPKDTAYRLGERLAINWNEVDFEQFRKGLS